MVEGQLDKGVNGALDISETSKTDNGLLDTSETDNCSLDISETDDKSQNTSETAKEIMIH